jgi:tetratricopeptide (TPR) repeat protein
MSWADFLDEIAASCGLSPEQTEAFVKRLDKQNQGKNEAKLADDLHIGEATFTKRMTGVYEKLAVICPELGASESRGKLEKLRACLRAKYTKNSCGAGRMPANGGQDAHPTGIYENLGRRGILNPKEFIGREEDLKTLHQLLQQNTQVAITAAVSGMGGVGKTELALQYARRHLKDYPGGVCWLSARNLALDIVNFARAHLPNFHIPDGLNTVPEQLQYCWSHWIEGDVLLVVDDVTDYKLEVKPFLPEAPRFKVVITTREKFARLVWLDLPVLTPEAALELLKVLVGVERVERELEAAQALCKWLGYLPLGLELVGHYLVQDGYLNLRLEQMLSRLEGKRLKQPALRETNDTMTAERGVAAAFELSWERLDENTQRLGCFLSVFANAPIPWKLAPDDVTDVTDEDEDDVEELEVARDRLGRLHLLQVSGDSCELHPLVREFFREKLGNREDADEMKGAFAGVMVKKAKEFPDIPTLELIKEITPFMPHIAEVAKNYTACLDDEDVIWVFVGNARFYAGQGLYKKAIVWGEECLQFTQQRFGKEHPDTALSLNNLALLYYSIGRYEEAEPLCNQALVLRKRLLGENHPDTASSYNNLAGLYESMGHYNEAEPLFNQALELRKHLLGENHPDIATSYNNLAALYDAMGRYNEAEPLFNQALELRKHLLGENHPDIATSYNNLAALYKSMRRYQEAEPLYKQALELRRRLLGEEHPSTATSYNNLALLYYSQRRYKEAEPLYKQALELRKRLLGEEHPHTASSYNNLASLYYSMGHYEEAEPLYKQALDLRKRLLGENHPDTAQSLNNLAELYRSQGRNKEVEPLYVQALAIYEHTIGVGNPDTRKVRGNYARFLKQSALNQQAKSEMIKFPPSVQAILDEI